MNDRSAQGAGSTGTTEEVREPWGAQAALVWGVLLLSAGLLIGYMVLFFQLEETRRSFADLGFGVVVVIFVIAGSFITLKEPRNLVGWMLTLFGFAALLSSFLNAYGLHAIAQRPRLPLAGLAATFDSAVGDWVPPLFLTFALMLFPNGKLPSPRWRWLAFVALIVYTGAFFAQLFRPGLTLRIPIENPLGIAGARESIDALRDLAGTVLGPLFVATAATLFVRRRRASGIEKHQLRWLFYVASLLAFDLVLGIVVEGLGVTTYDWIGILLFGASLVGIPIAIAIAILKYRLYDIDVVINKTLVFGALAAFITAVYVAVVVGIGALLGSSEEPNLVLSIAATALVAIAFQPVKERVQRVANRLVYGQRSTPYEVMANLSRVASGAIEPHDILPSVAAVAASGVGARAARVSLVLHSGDTLEATHPPELEDDLHYDVVVPLRHRDETIGELAVAKAAGEQLSPGDRKLLEDLAAQAALALHNARLAIELGARLDEISIQAHELDASRRRIVSAQDDSRRRLERDISSGPRLNLEDMRGELAAIKEVMDDDPQRAAGLLGELAGRANQTLDALRDLARGIFPPLLADKGIVAALEAHIRKHELDVELQADEGLRAARFDERVEIAVYFCCLEALASRSAQTVLALEVKDGELEMSCSGVVLDDARRETIRDRVEALAGTVRLGEGDGLRARFPVAMLEVAG